MANDFSTALPILMLAGTGGLVSVGIAFNLVLLRVLWRMGELWGSFTFRLITCVAGGDIVASLSIIGFGAFRAKLGYPGVIESAWYCRTFSFGLLFFHNMSGLAVAMIALDRYLVVRYQQRLRPLYARVVLGGIALVYAAVLAANAYQNAFRMDATNSFCLPGGKPVSTVAELFATVLVNSTLAILCFCYISIFLICLRIHRNNKQLFGRLPTQALVWLSAYLLCYLPKLVGTVWAAVTKAFPPTPIVMMMIFGLTGVVMINPILVLFLNTRAHQEFLAMLFPHSTQLDDNA